MIIFTIKDIGEFEPLYKQNVMPLFTPEQLFLQHHHMCKQTLEIIQVIYCSFFN